MTKVDEAVERLEKSLDFFSHEFDGRKVPSAITRVDGDDLALILSALKVRTEALEQIKRGGFNCSPHQWFMAAQGRAETALSQDPEDTP